MNSSVNNNLILINTTRDLFLKNKGFVTYSRSRDSLKMSICCFMCRYPLKVQDSYCSVQNDQDKQALYKDAASLNFVLSEQQASQVQHWRREAPLYNRELVLNILYTAVRILHRAGNYMTDQQIRGAGIIRGRTSLEVLR